MRFVLALDQGTTSSRAILFGPQGEIAGVAQHEFGQIYPSGPGQAGWVEHDPYDILTSQLTAAVEVLGRVGVRPRDVAALGITNQRETTIVWNRDTGKPVYNAIVWQDRRGASLCARLQADGAEETVRSKTGLLLDPYFSATKIAWILDNVEGARADAEAGRLAFGTVDSWLIWNLTSGKRHVTDRTNASRTLLYNIVDDRWDPELLRLLNIPESMLPEVVWSSQPVGPVTTSLGLGEIEIAGIAGDQQAALFGQLCVSPGDAKNTYGTGCFLLQNIGERFTLSAERLITTLACSPAQKLTYALEGSIFVGGAVVQWLRDNMRFFAASLDVESVAASVASSGGVVFVPAFTGLGAPHWDPYASGMIIGLGRGTEIGHIARAAIESIAFQVADVLEAMTRDLMQRDLTNEGLFEKDPSKQDVSEQGLAEKGALKRGGLKQDLPASGAQKPLQELRVDGGAASNNLLMHFQADLLQLPVRRPAVLETTALGAAYLAGLAVNFWSSTDEIAQRRAPDTVFSPQADPKQMQARQAKWRDAVTRARNWNHPA